MRGRCFFSRCWRFGACDARKFAGKSSPGKSWRRPLHPPAPNRRAWSISGCPKIHRADMYSPTLEEFLHLATQGNLIPVTRRLLADVETPLSAYRKIKGAGESFLFESVEGGEHLGRYSFVGCNPRAIVRQIGARVEVRENGKLLETFAVRAAARPGGSSSNGAPPEAGPVVRDGLEVVERVMRKYRAVPLPGLPRFTGGAVGFVGYEFIHDVEPVVPLPPRDELQTPVMYFLIADQLLIFDRVNQTLTVLVNAVLEDSSSPQE